MVHDVCSTLDASFGRLQGCSGQDANHGHSHLIAFPAELSGTQCAANENVSPCLSVNHTIAFMAGQGARAGSVAASEHISPTLRSSDSGSNRTPCVAFAQNTRDEVREMKVVGALAAQPGMKKQSYIRSNMQVRRLTPVECERLQGFPDNYTRIPWNGKPASECPDGHRYKALGNSMAVPVMRWIGMRINEVEKVVMEKLLT
jgi:DNA (cytosine-5)-methyltransferase 1